jgi:hypothetical protein
MQAFDPSTNPLNNNEWSFPLLEIIHIVSFAMSIGTIAIVDMRLLGLGMWHRTSAQLVKSTELWTQFGILLAVMSGIFLVSTDPANYLHNRAFRFKIACFLVAIVYNYTLHLKVAMSEHSAFAGRLAGTLSLALWIAVVFGGIFYAFI